MTNLFPYFTDVLTYDKMYVKLLESTPRDYNDGRLQHCVVDSSQEVGTFLSFFNILANTVHVFSQLGFNLM